MSDNIELVIKIPKEAHELLKNEGVDWLGAEHILNAVANGTPLSKELDALQGDIQDEVLKWHRGLYLSGRVDAADAVAFALKLVNKQFTARQEKEEKDDAHFND